MSARRAGEKTRPQSSLAMPLQCDRRNARTQGVSAENTCVQVGTTAGSAGVRHLRRRGPIAHGGWKHLAPVVVLQSTGIAVVDRGTGEPREDAQGMRGHGIDAVPLGQASHPEVSAADAACVAGHEVRQLGLERNPPFAHAVPAACALLHAPIEQPFQERTWHALERGGLATGTGLHTGAGHVDG